MKLKRITPRAGQIYLNHNGETYRCLRVNWRESIAIFRRRKDGWTLTAHNVWEYEDGTIEWDYSTDGHWNRS